MPEGSSTKKKPAWLTGEHPEETARATTVKDPPAGAGADRRGPLSEEDTGELPTFERTSVRRGGGPLADAGTRAVPRLSAPAVGHEKPGPRPKPSGNSPGELLERVRENPAPAALAALIVLVLMVAGWLLFLRGGGEQQPAASDEGAARGVIGAAPSSGAGPVRDTGVVFGALKEDGEVATLDGAGLSWEGTVTEKEGAAGETLTLEGPTAAQLERGFDLGPSSVETGVYAVAQGEAGGEVLHVTTHTFVPEEAGEEAREMTLGTIYSIEDGVLQGYAYYLDEREPGTDTITRTYVRPGQSTYRVSFEAPAQAAADGEGRAGTFVPLLVGWRGFED